MSLKLYIIPVAFVSTPCNIHEIKFEDGRFVTKASDLISLLNYILVKNLLTKYAISKLYTSPQNKLPLLGFAIQRILIMLSLFTFHRVFSTALNQSNLVKNSPAHSGCPNATAQKHKIHVCWSVNCHRSINVFGHKVGFSVAFHGRKPKANVKSRVSLKAKW